MHFLTVFAMWRRIITLLRRYPVIFTPFALAAVLDTVLLTILFLAPRPPFSLVLAPVIHTFWGEEFLHYPANFLILPKLFSFARNGVGPIVSILFTGVAVSLINQAYKDLFPEWAFGVRKAVKKYARLVVSGGIAIGILLLLIRILRYSTLVIWQSRKPTFGIEFLLSVIVQMLFVFTIPSIIVENKKICAAFWRSSVLFGKYPWTTLFFVIAPSSLLIPFNYFYAKLPLLMERFFPEIALFILLNHILVLTFIDFFVTLSATVLLLEHRGVEARAFVPGCLPPNVKIT